MSDLVTEQCTCERDPAGTYVVAVLAVCPEHGAIVTAAAQLGVRARTHLCDLPTGWFVDGYRCSCDRCWVREPGGEWRLCDDG